MLIESCSVPKYRDLSLPGDDILAVLPGRLYAVFDGATDAQGLLVQGMSSGRFAASQAALAMMTHAVMPERAARSPDDWLVSMNGAIAQGLQGANASAMRVGTTAALVEDAGGDSLRFLIVGDSGIRINGEELIWLHKDVDLIYSALRVAIFHFLQARGVQGDALEKRTRELVFLGLDSPDTEALLPADMDAIIVAARLSCETRLQADARACLEDLFRAGIARGQLGYANLPGHSLGYAVLNGRVTRGPEVLSFSRPKSSVRSIELFTDGYTSVPKGSRLSDWEAEFVRCEAEDFSKTGAYAGTKGSNSTQFSDDRTVLTVHFLA